MAQQYVSFSLTSINFVPSGDMTTSAARKEASGIGIPSQISPSLSSLQRYRASVPQTMTSSESEERCDSLQTAFRTVWLRITAECKYARGVLSGDEAERGAKA